MYHIIVMSIYTLVLNIIQYAEKPSYIPAYRQMVCLHNSTDPPQQNGYFSQAPKVLLYSSLPFL